MYKHHSGGTGSSSLLVKLQNKLIGIIAIIIKKFKYSNFYLFLKTYYLFLNYSLLF